MESITQKEIAKIDSQALAAIIDYWRDYDTRTILLACAELKSRNCIIPERLSRKLNDFATQNKFTSIDDAIKPLLGEATVAENTSKITQHTYALTKPSNIIAAGKSLKNIVYIVVIMQICLIITTVIFFVSGDIGYQIKVHGINITIYFLGQILLLFYLYSAANKLENSVSKRNASEPTTSTSS